MSFMQPEIFRGDYYEIETSAGTEILPCDAVGTFHTVGAIAEYLEGTYQGSDDDELEVKRGWLYRMSAPGYLDATSWGVAPTRRDAYAELLESYGSDNGDGDPEDWEAYAEEIADRK